jgi:hypothetical protein
MNEPDKPQTWDLKRFVKTLAYFKVIPFLSNNNLFQSMLGNPPNMDLNRKLEINTEAKTLTQNLTQNPTIFNFRDLNPQDLQNIQDAWGAVDDVVMGGVSQSQITITNNGAIFSGTVSTANSGGFASVRTRNFEPSLNLSKYEGIEVRIKGDGLRYKFLLRGESQWDGVAFGTSIDTEAERWITMRIPFKQLIASFRSKSIAGAVFNSTQVYSMQFMLSKFEYDGALNPKFKTGKFQLQIESISAY